LGLLHDLDLSTSADKRVRTDFVVLLNLVEEIKREDVELRAENKRLRDEINHRKGEQGHLTCITPVIGSSSRRSTCTAPAWNTH
jgi:hypothetical protein